MHGVVWLGSCCSQLFRSDDPADDSQTKQARSRAPKSCMTKLWRSEVVGMAHARGFSDLAWHRRMPSVITCFIYICKFFAHSSMRFTAGSRVV